MECGVLGSVFDKSDFGYRHGLDGPNGANLHTCNKQRMQMLARFKRSATLSVSPVI
jgi:hypothetical protein